MEGRSATYQSENSRPRKYQVNRGRRRIDSAIDIDDTSFGNADAVADLDDMSLGAKRPSLVSQDANQIPTEIACISSRQIELAAGYRGVSRLDVLALTVLPPLPSPALKECLIIAC